MRSGSFELFSSDLGFFAYMLAALGLCLVGLVFGKWKSTGRTHVKQNEGTKSASSTSGPGSKSDAARTSLTIPKDVKVQVRTPNKVQTKVKVVGQAPVYVSLYAYTKEARF